MSYSHKVLEDLSEVKIDLEQPTWLQVAKTILDYATLDAIAWAEHTSDWDYVVGVKRRDESQTRQFFGNPDLYLVHQGARITDLPYWLRYNTHKPAVDYNPRLFELLVIADVWNEYDDLDEQVHFYFGVNHIEALYFGYET